MGIGGITSTSSMSAMQMTTANITDSKSKNIQKEITDVQQQIQKLSSDETLSVNEKSNEQKQLQKEKSDLNTELKQHQEELLRSQKRESMLAELREAQGSSKKTAPDGKPAEEAEESAGKLPTEETSADRAEEKNPTAGAPQNEQAALPGTVITQSSDGTVILKEVLSQQGNAIDTAQDPSDETEDTANVSAAKEAEATENDTETVTDTDAGLSGKEMHAMVSADVSSQQADRLGTIIAKTNDGIAVLKGEIKQDERRGADTERKQAELEQMEKRAERAEAFQFSVLGGANHAMKSAAETNTSESQNQAGNVENNAFASALKATQEEQAQQRFYVSFG